jgi:hypothetical protein
MSRYIPIEKMTDQEVYDTFKEVREIADQIYRDLLLTFEPGFIADTVALYDPRSLAVRLYRAGWRKMP